jgi:hypothetical protein
MLAQLRIVLILVLVALAAGACGEDSSDTVPRLPLTETYTSATGLSLRYPQDWSVEEDSDDGVILVANRWDVLGTGEFRKGQAGLVIVPPARVAELTGNVTSPKEALSAAIQGMSPGAQFGTIQESLAGSRMVARAYASSGESEGFALAIALDQNTILVAFGGAARGELKEYEATLLEIAASVTTP